MSLPDITYKMLGNGAWGVMSYKELLPGDIVTVVKKDGSTTTETIQAYNSDNKYSKLVEIDGIAEYKNGLIYTIEKKYKKGQKWKDPQEQTEEINNKPKNKKCTSPNCGHYESNHWDKDNSCGYHGCECKEFITKYKNKAKKEEKYELFVWHQYIDFAGTSW